MKPIFDRYVWEFNGACRQWPRPRGSPSGEGPSLGLRSQEGRRSSIWLWGKNLCLAMWGYSVGVNTPFGTRPTNEYWGHKEWSLKYQCRRLLHMQMPCQVKSESEVERKKTHLAYIVCVVGFYFWVLRSRIHHT